MRREISSAVEVLRGVRKGDGMISRISWVVLMAIPALAAVDGVVVIVRRMELDAMLRNCAVTLTERPTGELSGI